jgi:hypothetical protein
VKDAMRARMHTPPYKLAVEARREVALALEKKILLLVKKSPGLSAYDASLKMRKPPSTVHSAIKRMTEKGELVTRNILRKTGKITLLYPQSYSLPDNTLIEIPREVIDMGNPSWLDAFIYALNSESIGISGESVPEWESNCLWKEKAKVDREQKELLVKLPAKIANFYQVQKKEVMQVFLNNKTLLTITGIVQG